MKHIIIIMSMFTYHVIYSQTPVLPFDEKSNALQGAYYKDFDNILNDFDGSWIYTNGNTLLTITLQKKVMAHINIGNENYYEDVIVGEYKYIENGVVKINTLPQLNSGMSPYEQSITGTIVTSTNPIRIITYFSQVNVDVVGLEAIMIIERADIGNTKKLKVNFKMTSAPAAVNGVSPQTTYTLPYGEYILTKQP